MKPIELGKPAEWAAKQKWKRRGASLQSIGYAILAVLAVALVVTVLILTDAMPPWVATLIAVAAAGAGAAFIYAKYNKAKASWKRAGQADIGVKSERQVRRTVRRKKPPITVYGAKLGPKQGDVDMILIDQNLHLAAVEIKTGFGKVSVDGNQIRAGRKVMPRDPLGQCQKAARRLNKAMNTTSLPVVCVPGMNNAPFIHDGVVICNAKDLVKAVAHYGSPAFDSMETALSESYQLWQNHKRREG